MNLLHEPKPPRRMMELLQDRYVFLSVLGHGGSGTVYEVRNIQLERVEALKVLDNSMSPETTRRFVQEARISASLDHPGIVRVYDFGQLDGAIWYSMQLIDGPSLSDIMESKKRIDATGASRLGVALLEALAFSHKNGIIHRDIKPANILIQPSGYPCLTDFGIAKFSGSNDFTETGSMMGTPAYMAPEQAEGKPVDGRTDQYALAITLYRAIAGKLPFSSDEPMATLVLRLKEDPEPIEWHCPEFPEPLRRVLMKALSREMDDRYPTIEEMQKELQLAAASCNIHWNKPFDGYEHKLIVRKPIEICDVGYLDDYAPITAQPPKSDEGRKGFLLGAALVAFIAIACAIYFMKPDATSGNNEGNGSAGGVAPSESIPVKADETSPTPTPSNPKTPAESRPTPSPETPPKVTPVRRPVSTAVLVTEKLPESIVIPPELDGKMVQARVTVGENGKVVKCTILNKGLSPTEMEFARSVAMVLEFSPALAEDGNPVESECTVAVPLRRTN
ncbi:MAG: protein kinase [Holophagaceae bacterium]|nr:protein kinase [Holophagaceae bacterium]